MLRLALLALAGLSLSAAFAAPRDEFIRVGDDHFSFVTKQSKTRFIPVGTNFVLNSKKYLNLFGPEVYDGPRYERCLAEIEGLGCTLVKVFLPIAQVLPDPQVSGDAHIAPGYFENLESFIKLAREHNIRVEISLCSWGGNGIKWWHDGGEYFGRKPWKTDAGVDSLDVLNHFWTKLCTRFRDNPTVFSYTPEVEWSFPATNLTWKPPDKQWGTLETEQGVYYWRAFLRARYKDDLAAMNKAYGSTFAHFEDVPVANFDYDFGKHAYGDPDAKILDYQNFREWASRRYFKPQLAAMRKADPNHMVTISNHMRRPIELWEGSAVHFIGFSEPEQSDMVDYLTSHDNHAVSDQKPPTPIEDIVRGSIVRTRFCNAYKKMPVIIEEYTYGAPDEATTADVQERMLRGTIGSASGWTNWYLHYPSDANEADTPATERSAILRDDYTPTAWGQRLRVLTAELAKTDLSRKPAGQVVTADRMKSLVPHELGVAYDVCKRWDAYKQPVDYIWPHNEWLDMKLIGEH